MEYKPRPITECTLRYALPPRTSTARFTIASAFWSSGVDGDGVATVWADKALALTSSNAKAKHFPYIIFHFSFLILVLLSPVAFVRSTSQGTKFPPGIC